MRTLMDLTTYPVPSSTYPHRSPSASGQNYPSGSHIINLVTTEDGASHRLLPKSLLDYPAISVDLLLAFTNLAP